MSARDVNAGERGELALKLLLRIPLDSERLHRSGNTGRSAAPMRGDSEPTRGAWRLWGAEQLAQGPGRGGIQGSWGPAAVGGDEEAGGQRHGRLGGVMTCWSAPVMLTCLLRKLKFIFLPSG